MTSFCIVDFEQVNVYWAATVVLELLGEVFNVKDYLQILLLQLSELINFFYPWNHQKTIGFLIISGGI